MTSRVTEVPRLSWAEVCARRLERHALSAPAQDARPADIVAAMCGAHAQVLSAAELSIGLRLAGVTRADVREALWTEHSLVKTFGPRGTVHLLPTRDLPMWTGALSAIPPSTSPFPQDVRLTPEQTDAVVAAIAVALDDAELTDRRADRGDRRRRRTVGRGPGHARLPGHVAALAAGHGHGGEPGRAVLRPQPGPQGHLHQPAPLAARLPPRRWADRPRRPRPALPARVRAGHAAAVRAVAGRAAPVGDGAVRLPWPASSSRSRSRAPAPGWWPGTPRCHPRHPGACGCCRTSTPTSSAAIRASCSSPAAPPSARWPAARRELPGAADRRHRRRGLAPAPLRPQSSTITVEPLEPAHRRAAPRARRSGGTRRGDPRRHAPVDHRHGDGRRARLSGRSQESW